MLCFFFKYTFSKRVGYVIFELHEGSINNFIKLKFLSICFKIKQAFEEQKKMDQKGLSVFHWLLFIAKNNGRKCFFWSLNRKVLHNLIL